MPFCFFHLLKIILLNSNIWFGCSKDCFHRNIIVKDGATSTFVVDSQYEPTFLRMFKTSRGGSDIPLIGVSVFRNVINDIAFGDDTYETRTNVNLQLHSNITRVMIDLSDVTMKDNGKYELSASTREDLTTCFTFTLFILGPPIRHLTLVPDQLHYFLVTGDAMPDITCISDCNLPCNVSWGKHSKGNTLSLGEVTTESTGEYTCTAKRSDGATVDQRISLYVTEKSYLITAISCFGSAQAFTILVLGLIVFFSCKRKLPSCCLRNKTSKENKEEVVVTFSTSEVQGADNMVYEELKDETRNKNNTYSEVNLSITDDEVQHSRNKYENTKIAKKNTNEQQK